MPQTRPARRINRSTVRAGSIVKLSPDDGKVYQYLTVKTPSGILVLVPMMEGSYPLWVPEVGTYMYRWGEGESRALEVIEAEQGDQVEAAMNLVKLPSMSITRRPRF